MEKGGFHEPPLNRGKPPGVPGAAFGLAYSGGVAKGQPGPFLPSPSLGGGGSTAERSEAVGVGCKRTVSPLFSKARGGLPSLFCPPDKPEDGAPRGAQTVHLAVPALPGERRRPAPRGAPSRCRTNAGPRFWRLIQPFGWVAPTISELLAGGHSASGRSPGAARALKVRFLEPAGTASFPTDKTPHDSAPGRIGREDVIL